MAFYSAFQGNAYQRNAFQIKAQPTATGGSGGDKEDAYLPTYQKYLSDERQQERQREKIRREKTELERLESVLRENERKRALAEQSRLAAKEAKKLKRAIELEKLEREYLNEINRLLMVRAGILRRIKASEEALIIMIIARKRRLRIAIQPAGIKMLALNRS